MEGINQELIGHTFEQADRWQVQRCPCDVGMGAGTTQSLPLLTPPLAPLLTPPLAGQFKIDFHNMEQTSLRLAKENGERKTVEGTRRMIRRSGMPSQLPQQSSARAAASSS